MGGWLAENVSFEASFLVAGLITCTGVLPMLLMRHRVERPLNSVPVARAAPSSLWAVLRAHWRDLATAGTGHVLASAARAGRQVIIPIYAAFVLDLGRGRGRGGGERVGGHRHDTVPGLPDT